MQLFTELNQRFVTFLALSNMITVTELFTQYTDAVGGGFVIEL